MGGGVGEGAAFVINCKEEEQTIVYSKCSFKTTSSMSKQENNLKGQM